MIYCDFKWHHFVIKSLYTDEEDLNGRAQSKSFGKAPWVLV